MTSHEETASSPNDAVRQLVTGHTAAVACLASFPSGGLVASGSEDGTVRLWNSSTQQVLVIIRCHAEVQAIALCPTTADQDGNQDQEEVQNKHERDDSDGKQDKESTTSVPPPTLPILLLACDNTMYLCNIDSISISETNNPTIRSVDTLQTIWQTTDEINQISWTCAPAPTTGVSSNKGSRKKKKKPRAPPPCVWIATADDAGQVWIAPEPWNHTVGEHNTIVLSHSTDQALCLTALLHTSAKGRLELLSGGSDCRVVQWQQQQPSGQLAQQSVIDVSEIEESAGGPLWNPPMVHQITWSPSNYVAAACGDGQVRLFQTDSGRLVLTAAVEHAAVPACAVAVGNDIRGDKSHDIPPYRLLWTAGNDGFCKLWDVGTFAAGMDAAHENDLEHGNPRLLQTLLHGAKPNALVVTEDGKLWVADTSSNISIYDATEPS